MNLPARMQESMETAKVMSVSDLLPYSYRNKPQNLILAWEMGRELGMTPMASLTAISVIDGRPTLSAAAQAALVRRAGHKIRVEVSKDGATVTASLIRSDDPDFTFHSVWTMERAEKAGLSGRGAWATYPIAMMQARAISDVIRTGASDVLLGLGASVYDPSELGGQSDVERDDHMVLIEVTDDDIVEVEVHDAEAR